MYIYASVCACECIYLYTSIYLYRNHYAYIHTLRTYTLIAILDIVKAFKSV